jgi:hypothetical protein
VTIPRGGVYSLCCGEGREEWERGVVPNVRHIVRGVVRGTAYLHENMSIQHVDLKGMYIISISIQHIHLSLYVSIFLVSLGGPLCGKERST